MNINYKNKMEYKIEKLARDIGMIYPEEAKVLEDFSNNLIKEDKGALK